MIRYSYDLGMRQYCSSPVGRRAAVEAKSSQRSAAEIGRGAKWERRVWWMEERSCQKEETGIGQRLQYLERQAES